MMAHSEGEGALKATCFALEPSGGLRPEAEATVLAGWRAGAGPYWIDLGGGRPEAVTAWLAGLDPDPGMLDLLPIDAFGTIAIPKGNLASRQVPLFSLIFMANS